MSNEEANLERLHAEWWELKQAVRAVLDEYLSVERIEPGRPIPGPARTFDSDGVRRIEEAERKAEAARERYNRAPMLHMGADQEPHPRPLSVFGEERRQAGDDLVF